MGLRGRLLLLVVFAVIPAFGVIGYSALSERSYNADAAQSNAMTLVHFVAHEQRRLIAETEELLKELAQLPVAQPSLSTACSRVMTEVLKTHSHYNNIGVATLDGDIYCSALPMAEGINIADRVYFQRTVRSRAFSIGGYQIGRITSEPAINFGYPVLDENKKLRGVIYVAMSLNAINQMISQFELPVGSAVTIVDGGGAILARRPDPDMWGGLAVLKMPLVSTILENNGLEGSAEIEDLDRVRRLSAFAPLHIGNEGRIFIAVGVPTEVAFGHADRQFAINLMLLLMVAVLAFAAAWWGGNAFVLRSVQALANAARRLAAGDMSARTGLTHRDGEIGELARSFDEMAGALQRVNRALKTLNAGNRVMVWAGNEQSLLNEMCRVIVEVGGYRMAWIGYAEEDERRTVRAVAEYGFEGGLPALTKMIDRISWSDNEYGRGAVGTAIRTGQVTVMRELGNNPNMTPWRDELVRRQYVCLAGFPLCVHNRPIGALAIYAPEKDAFNQEELEVLEEATNDLAFGLEVLRARIENDRAQATIKRLAFFDRLTGLPNHAQFEEHLRRSLPEVDAQNTSLALIVLDIDRLNEINDALGFHQGDMLLKDVAARIRDVAKSDAMVARMRGDEFAVVCVVNNDEDASSTVRTILSSLRAPFTLGELSLSINAVAGISLFPRDSTDATQLMRRADVALRQAKKTGKDFMFYASEQDKNSAQHLVLAGELRRTIEAGELVLYYQPKFEIPSGRVCGVEALVRWPHPARGIISPEDFIGLAEHTGLIKPLTDWVIAAALRQSVMWREVGIVLPIAINLSPRNLRDVELVDKVARLIQAYGAEAGWLQVEITEGAMMEDPEGALSILRQLNNMDITMSIDDFGTGFSSLSYIKKLPVDEVKIDKSFVMDMLNNADSAAIVRSTIDLAHDLGLRVVAEGVESDAILERLIEQGCDVAQGYFFSKPLPPEQFRSWFEDYTGGPGRISKKPPVQRRQAR